MDNKFPMVDVQGWGLSATKSFATSLEDRMEKVQFN